MAVNFNDTTPAAPGGGVNVTWQVDGSGNASAYVNSSGILPTFVDGEAPSGTIDGSNATFTLAHAPNPVDSLKLYVNGIRQRLTTDYSLSSTTITYTSGAKPQTGDNHVADYRY
jgi:hypothetical protein